MSQQLMVQLFETGSGEHRLNLVTPAAEYTFSATEVSGLICALATSRARMFPAVETEAPSMTGFQNAADDPPARWAYDEMNDRFALLIRHPGYGWIAYALPPRTMEALQKSLQEVAVHRAAQRQRPN